MRQGKPFLYILALFLFSCDPLVTTFDDVEKAVLYEAKNISTASSPEGSLKVLTWNIRFGIGRLPFFGDSCGDRSIFTENEVLDALSLLLQKSISLIRILFYSRKSIENPNAHNTLTRCNGCWIIQT